MTPKGEIETLGHAIVRDVLSPGEIASLRDVVLGHFAHSGTIRGMGRYQGAAASTVSGLEALLCHPRLLAAFSDLLGAGPLVFTGSADMHWNILNIWHRDSSALGVDAWTGDYFSRESCRVYRAGIYLQSHETDGLGLNVIRGSHRRSDLAGLPTDTLRQRAGDVAFIDCRTMHAGVLPNRFENILRGASRRLGEPAWLAMVNDLLWRVRRQDRLSIFLGFGLKGPEVEEFCRFDLHLRRRRVGSRCLLRPAARDALAAAGVVVYEDELEQRYGARALQDFAAGGPLPDERLWT